MVLPAAIALMTYGAYRSHKQNERDAAQEEEDRKEKQEDRAFRKSERDRAVTTRAKMADAAAPVAAVDGTTYQPEVDDDGNPMPANPTAGTYKVAGQRFTDKATADAAAMTANTPAARTARMSAVMDESGDVAGAQALRTSARQEAVAGLQLTAAEAAAEKTRKMQDMGRQLARGGWAALPSIYDQYNDGFKATVQEDDKGGATVQRTDPAGKPVGKPMTYASLADFYAEAAAEFDPAKWVDRIDKKAETARLQGNSDRDYALRDTEAKRKAKHDEGVLRNDGERLRIARMAADTNAAVGGIPMKDIQANLNRAGDIIRKDMKIGGDPLGTTDPAAEKAAIEAADRLTTQSQRLIMGAAQVGVPLTAEMAIEAMRTGKVRTQQIRNPETGELANVQVMEVGGRLIPLALTAPTPENVGGGRGSVTPQRMDQPAPAPAPMPAPPMPRPSMLGDITYRPDEDAPSIYDGPSAWAAYRAAKAPGHR